MDFQDALTVEIKRDGTTVLGSTGQPRAHPAGAERRSNALAIGRLLGQLGIDENGEALLAPQAVGECPMVAAADRIANLRQCPKGGDDPLAWTGRRACVSERHGDRYGHRNCAASSSLTGST